MVWSCAGQAPSRGRAACEDSASYHSQRPSRVDKVRTEAGEQGRRHGQTRTDVIRRHGVAAHGLAGEPDADRRRLRVQRHDRVRTSATAVRRAFRTVRALSQLCGAGPDRLLLGTRRQLRPRLSCCAHGVAGQGHDGRPEAAGRAPRLHRARPEQALMAGPSGRQLQRRTGADRPHSPLHRRRHRTDRRAAGHDIREPGR